MGLDFNIQAHILSLNGSQAHGFQAAHTLRLSSVSPGKF